MEHTRYLKVEQANDWPVINNDVMGEPVVVLNRNDTSPACDCGIIAHSRLMPSATAYSRRVNHRILGFVMRDSCIVDD